MLSVLLVASSSAKAGTIEYVDAARATSEGRYTRPATELRLRVMSQSGQPQVASGTQSASQSGGDTSSQDQSNGATQTGTTPASTDATLTQSSGGGQIETVDLGDVTGTVCDCGEIPIERKPGGFPKWPFLALAGIPLAFIHHTDDNPLPPDTPTPPTPPTTPTPEPATLFLFGSGLLALGSNARRRRARKLAAHEVVATGGGEV